MRIKIFLTSSCHYCNKAKEYLKKRGADFIAARILLIVMFGIIQMLQKRW